MAGVIRLQRTVFSKIRLSLKSRNISTSKKKQETITITEEGKSKVAEAIESKDWQSYGFHRYNKKHDRQAAHLSFFGGITLCIVGVGFICMYRPDYNLKDWSQREGFLELRRREALGLPLVDRNLIDPSKIKLPSDEELGDTEIII